MLNSKRTNNFHEWRNPQKNNETTARAYFEQKRVNHKENIDSFRRPRNNLQKKFTNVLVSQYVNFRFQCRGTVSRSEHMYQQV